MLLLVDEDVASPWGVFGSAGRSDFVVWVMLSILLLKLKVGWWKALTRSCASSTQIRKETERRGEASQRHVHFLTKTLTRTLLTALSLCFHLFALFAFKI